MGEGIERIVSYPRPLFAGEGRVRVRIDEAIFEGAHEGHELRKRRLIIKFFLPFVIFVSFVVSHSVPVFFRPPR